MKRFIIVSVLCVSIGLPAVLPQSALADAAALSSQQVQAIVALLRSFGAADSLVQGVSDVLSGRATVSTTSSASFVETPWVDPTATTSVTVLSPDTAASFLPWQTVGISWRGGTGKVQLGLIDETFDTNHTVLGWISRSEKPNSSFNWDGWNVSDITGTVSQPVTSLSKGPYKVIAVSAGANGSFCVLPDSGCNYDVSADYFSITPLPASGGLSVSCSPSIVTAETGEVVTWEATTTSGKAPYVYSWGGTDGISSLPTRASTSTSNSRFLDVIYYSAAPSRGKTAVVFVRDGAGETGFAPCSGAVTVTPAPPAITVLSPVSGESFVMTRTADPSQSMRVSWRADGVPKIGKEKLQVALLDAFGRECLMGSVPRQSNEALIGLLYGFACPGGTFTLLPGSYRVKVYLEGKGTKFFAVSDTPVTLTAPIVADIQSITSSAASINSGGNVSFRFVFPPNAFKGSLHIFCPDGVTASVPNTCNRYISVTSYMASSTDYSVTLANSSSDAKTVAANFYVYLPNNPNYGRGVSAKVTVLSPSAASSDAISVVSPNGGETVSLGYPYLYRFTATLPGVVDLTLVPYPPIDASLVCKIATGVVGSAGQVSVTIPLSGICPNGPAKTVSGDYKLLATLRSGNTNISSDLSDATFTVGATTTPSQ